MDANRSSEAPWIASGIAQSGTVAYPMDAAIRVAWLSVLDLGAYVGAALRRPDLAGQSIDIGGPQTLDGHELARELGRAANRSVQYITVPPALVEHQLGTLLGADVAKEIARTYAWFAEHSESRLFVGTSSELARDLRRVPQSVYEWASAKERVELFRATAA